MTAKNTTKIGKLGEQIATKYLIERSFYIKERNYGKKFGEIDIIAEFNGVVHYVEVKSVSHKTIADLEYAFVSEGWQPEELVHERKLHQIRKAAEAWCSERGYSGLQQIDVVAVHYVPAEKYATVKLLENA